LRILAEVSDTALGGDRVQPDIVRLRIHRFGALALEGETDQVGSAPVMPVAPEGERAIVEPAAHAEAPAPAIDTHERHDDEAEPTRGDGAAARGGMWNRDAEHAAARLAGQGVETQAGVAPALDHGHIDAHAPPPCRDQERGGVRLSIEGQVDRHPGSRLERGQAGDGGRGEIRVEGVIGGAEPAPARAQLLPQLGFHGLVDAHEIRGWRRPHVPFWTVAPDLSNRWG